MKIIVVDDSAILRKRIISMLTEIAGLEIAGEAENSVEAINLIEKIKPDFLVLDIRMPAGNGLQVLKYIQQKKITMIKILLTNYPLDQYKTKCKELGSDYFFDKGTEFEMVRVVIEKIMLDSKQ